MQVWLRLVYRVGVTVVVKVVFRVGGAVVVKVGVSGWRCSCG